MSTGFGFVVLGSFQGILWGLLAFALVVISLLLIAIILIQDPKGGGLTSAFGSGPGGESLLGGRAQHDITVWTSWLTAAFIIISIVLVIMDPDKSESIGVQGAGASPATIQTPLKEEPEGPKPNFPGLPQTPGAAPAGGTTPAPATSPGAGDTGATGKTGKTGESGKAPAKTTPEATPPKPESSGGAAPPPAGGAGSSGTGR